MRTRLDQVQGIDWFNAAILNAEWEGPLLRDVLLKAGFESQRDDLHVAFACYQTKCQDDDWYGGSIPISRAMGQDAEVLLALKVGSSIIPVGLIRNVSLMSLAAELRSPNTQTRISRARCCARSAWCWISQIPR